jgi:thioredoxin reductase (NADPH)
MDYELAIVGAGPAGYSAGIYAVRAGIRTVLFDKGDGGGLAAIAPNIENYAGFPSITGMDLMEKMKDHAKRYVDIHLYEEVESIEIEKTDNKFLLKTSEEQTYSVGAILLATGTQHRKLDCTGSKEFEGKGVSYCATCDGFFFKGKNVGVVGGGNSALIEAIYLKQIGCNHVYLIHRRDQLRAEEAYEHDAKKAGVEVLLNKVIKEIKGNEKVQSIVLEDTKTSETSTVDVDGIFVSIGVIPQNEIAKKLGVDIDEHGYIKVGKQMRTNVKGVYAAGDIAGGLRQIITAAAEGAIAALTSTEVLGKQYPY